VTRQGIATATDQVADRVIALRQGRNVGEALAAPEHRERIVAYDVGGAKEVVA
jgi:hypothetical protein